MGFVSNSSSSSFIVKFDNKKKTEPLDFDWNELFSLIVYHTNSYGEGNDIVCDKERLYSKLFDYNQNEELKMQLNAWYGELKADEGIALIELNMHVPVIPDIINNSKHIKVLKKWSD